MSERRTDETLDGRGRVRRCGDVVLRPLTPWSPAVLTLLHHLETEGFRGAPRVVGDGTDGTDEVVTFVPGPESAPAWLGR